MSLIEPATGIVNLKATMSFISLRAQTNFLYFDLRLGFFRLTFLLCLFVNKLTKVHYAANRRRSTGRDLYKIHLGIAGNLQGLLNGNNTYIASIGPDQANLRDADAFIHSKLVGAYSYSSY